VRLRTLDGSRQQAGNGAGLQDRYVAVPVLANRRRALQVTLGLLWLLDAALQFQPYMFTRAFVSQVIQPAVAGNPGIIAGPITWSAGLMMRHIVACNAAFATIQLLLAIGLLWRPTVKAALAASIVWAAGVWWIGEGLGGLLTGTVSPLTGAPGAAVLYVLLALLAWPSGGVHAPRASVASSGRLGATAPRVLWAVLWAGLGLAALQSASRPPGRLAAILSGVKAGEPGWIKAMDSALAHAAVGHGTQASITLAALCTLAAAAIALRRFTRLGVFSAAIVGAVIWIAEDFGGIFTGQGTDPNSGLLLVVVAAAFWPLATPAQDIAEDESLPGFKISAGHISC
jgi:hypothetical protein